MRLSFRIPTTISVDDLEFGPGLNIVESPKADELRINNNTFCWQLLTLRFELGKNHNTATIKAKIPEAFWPYFQDGTAIA